MEVLHINNYLQKGGAETVFKLTIEGLKRYYPNVDNYVVYSVNRDIVIEDKNNKYVVQYAFLVRGIVFSFFTNFFSRLNFLFNIAEILIIYQFVVKRKLTS